MKQLRLIDVGNPRHTIEDFHYLGTMPSGKTYIFMFREAVCVYSIPANKNIGRFLFGIDVDMWEFSRCWAPNGHDPNLMSQAIAATIKMLVRAEPTAAAVVAYADPNVGHSGGVYRAASWVFTGQSEESRYYVGPDGETVSRRSFHSGTTQLTKAQIEARGYSELRRPGKLRFVRGLKPWTRKALRKFCTELEKEVERPRSFFNNADVCGEIGVPCPWCGARSYDSMVEAKHSAGCSFGEFKEKP